MATVCLAMMVKNEAKIIKRCLKAAWPWIDSWLICDTGSTDGTQEIIRDYLKDIPGELVEVPWVDFGHNRSQVVGLANSIGPKADYLLLLDADLGIDFVLPEGEVLDLDASVQHLKDSLTADAYELRYAGGLDYTNTRLISTKFDWHYVGVTHEYITSSTAKVYEELPCVRLVDFADGGNRSDKFLRDVQLLSRALAVNTDDMRSAFYLGQSYKDLGRYKQAQYWYEHRIKYMGFDEERWYAMYQAARMAMLAGDDWDAIVLPLFLTAFHYRPTRIEPIYEIVRHYREVGGRYELGFFYASLWGHGFAYPKQDRLFIDTNIYRHLMPYEFAWAAVHVGRVELAEAALEKLKRDSDDAPWMRQWIEKLAMEIVRVGLADSPGIAA